MFAQIAFFSINFWRNKYQNQLMMKNHFQLKKQNKLEDAVNPEIKLLKVLKNF